MSKHTLSKLLWWKFKWDHKDSCADNNALYIQELIDGEWKYFKLVPTEVTIQEYDSAWDRASNGDK